MLIDKATLLVQLAPPLDQLLTEQLVDEYISQEKRFIQRDWEPSELDGGQFCEALSRLLYHVDSGNLNRSKDCDDCLRYIENEQVPHALVPRQTALHMVRLTRTVYKFRSARGAVHISPTYKANHLDARLVLEGVRWLFAEALRIWWKDDREKVAAAIRELIQFDVPAVGKFGNVLMVQRVDLSTDDEVLVLLHYAGERGFSRRELGQYAMRTPDRVTRSIQDLASAELRRVIKLESGNFRLSDVGSKYVRENLADKLFIA